MLTRIITAVVLIAAVLAWLFVADFAIFTVGALFMYIVAAYEMGSLLGFKNKVTFTAIAMVASTVCFWAVNPGTFVYVGIPRGIQYLVASGVIVWVVAIPLLLKFPHDTKWHQYKILNAVLGLLMLLPFLMGLIVLRVSSYSLDQKAGAYLVLAVMALVWCADSGAYFTGRFLGKHKMLPNVSPKKTMEGLLGCIVTALVGMFIFLKLGFFGEYGSHLGVIVAASVLTIVFSVIGDLVESMFKRLVGIKDSGKIFPGHGGMLDRIYSQLAAIPVFLTSVWLFSGALF